MVLTASALRKDIYRLLDRVAEEGRPLTITRKGHQLKITPDAPVSKLSRLVPHDCMTVDPESLVHQDWSGEWRHDLS